jgi:hypothetical protein
MEENTLLLFQGELCAFVRIKKFSRHTTYNKTYWLNGRIDLCWKLP